MKTITQFMKTRKWHSQKKVEMIASELKEFPENLKFLLKHDNNQVIYNYKLNQYNTMTPPMSTTPNDSPFAIASQNSDSGQSLRSP